MFYAVAKGHRVGIYKTWELCKEQVAMYPGAIFRKFKTEKEALTFINGNGSTILGQLGIQGIEITRVSSPVKVDIEEYTSSPNHHSKNIICFSDGSCINNGSTSLKKPPMAGYACCFTNYPEYTEAKNLRSQPNNNIPFTNNRAEYTALIRTLEICQQIDRDKSSTCTTLEFYTDSQVLINTATKWISSWKEKGWRKANGDKVLNLDLVMKIDILMKERKVLFKHVRAHTEGVDWMSKWNEKADELAKLAAQGIEYPYNGTPTIFAGSN